MTDFGIATERPDKERIRVRRAAIANLEEIGDKRAVPSIIDALDDQNAEVRYYAVAALGKLGDTRALPALERLQLHDNGDTLYGHAVKELASEAMDQIRQNLP